MVSSSALRPQDVSRVAPAAVYRGDGILASVPLQLVGSRALIVGGPRSLTRVQEPLQLNLHQQAVQAVQWIPFGRESTEAEVQRLVDLGRAHASTGVIGVGGGKALDSAKLVAHHLQQPIITVPTSAATCAAWSALSNLYSPQGAFLQDVSLTQTPLAVVLDYDILRTAPMATLRAGIGDALAKWYEASVSSSASKDVLIIAALQQARVLRDLLFQQAETALQFPGSSAWYQVVDACICLAGVVGGLGGAQCRTVAAHAVHNGLTHLIHYPQHLHGDKVAFGILVQLRLEEILQGSRLAVTARKQLIDFYRQIQLPVTLADLGLPSLTSMELRQVAEVACAPGSDIHHLPFPVLVEALVVAMQTTALEVNSSTPLPVFNL
ncbi:MAG: iron-containing alcohol dehydrogenase family protein [Synechococcaceae cyanobacterium SM2_3_1]|nr:iron-containing alcohol dehydrogenase family protein [Synechococcaceae cyanobacterium SM2_3_1]